MKLTYKYRIKDRNSKKQLALWADKVNLVWNYCRETARKAWRRNRRTLSGYDLSNLTSGSSKELKLPAQTIQAIGEQLSRSAKQHRKIPKFRSYKKNLSWIPFKATSVRMEDDTIHFNGHKIKIWKSRNITGAIKTGSFTRDCLGRWYVSLVCDIQDVPKKEIKTKVGIDLGLKDQLTLSDGIKYHRENITKQYEDLLAKALQRKDYNRARKIHTKIKNIRKDWEHKTTTKIAEQYDHIVIGNIKTKQIGKINKRLNKSLHDASWFSLKTTLKYKAIKLGGEYKEVSEAYTTQTCHTCGARAGPKGTNDLGVRFWECEDCGITHDRDINAAINILRKAGVGHDPLSGIPLL